MYVQSTVIIEFKSKACLGVANAFSKRCYLVDVFFSEKY